MDSIKRRLYFVAARYFRFWAKIQLRRWHPRIFVITGSSGKTTMLHLAEAQLGDNARYSHKANSSFGVPFDILGMSRKQLRRSEWLGLVTKAPFRAFKSIHKHEIYVVEVDCDRPGEGKFLADLLKPEGVIWLSSTQTHAMNFDGLVKSGKFKNVEEAIAHEFAYLAKSTSGFLIFDRDNRNIRKYGTIGRFKNATSAIKLVSVSKARIKKFHPSLDSTVFEFSKPDTDKIETLSVPALVPQAVGLSVRAVYCLCKLTQIKFDSKFEKFTLPPGRSSVFAGIKDTTLIDSTYNASLDAATEMLQLMDTLKAKTKWLVVSDVLEQGESEQRVHQQLAHDIAKYKFDKIIVMGPRCKKFCSPVLTQLKVEHTAVETPREVLDILESKLTGGETILFKGTRFLEGVIEHLLKDQTDASKLCRREAVWVKRRRAWGL